MTHLDEIECPDCEGEGRIWNNADPTSGQCAACDACGGGGWREETDEERDDRSANAFSDMCAGEPPLTMAERAGQQAKREAQWGAG